MPEGNKLGCIRLYTSV